MLVSVVGASFDTDLDALRFLYPAQDDDCIVIEVVILSQVEIVEADPLSSS